MPSPKITVLLPAWNAEDYIAQTIESILYQTFRNFELLIINDASTDKTEEIIQSFKDNRIRYIKNEKNLRLIQTLNKGIKLAKGQYIARIDSDDIAYPDRLQKQIDFLETNIDVAVLGTDIEFINLHGKNIGKGIIHPTTNACIKWGMQRRTALYHPTVMVNTKLTGDDFYYDMDYIHAEDYELWLRLSKKFKLANLPIALLKYRIHSSSITSSHTKISLESTLKALKTHISPNFSKKIIELVRFPQNLSCKNDVLDILKVWPSHLEGFIKSNQLETEDKWLLQNNAIEYVVTLSFFSLIKTKSLPIIEIIRTFKSLNLTLPHIKYIFICYLRNFYFRLLLKKVLSFL